MVVKSSNDRSQIVHGLVPPTSHNAKHSHLARVHNLDGRVRRPTRTESSVRAKRYTAHALFVLSSVPRFELRRRNPLNGRKAVDHVSQILLHLILLRVVQSTDWTEGPQVQQFFLRSHWRQGPRPQRCPVLLQSLRCRQSVQCSLFLERRIQVVRFGGSRR